MKKLTAIFLILLALSISAGCMYIDPFINAGNTIVTTGQSTIDSQCKFACDNHHSLLPPGCTCPTPTPTPAK